VNKKKVIMHEPQTLSWLFFDLNSYFASVEQQDHPELRGRPVAVVPSDTDFTSAIAASYEAKAYGVKAGTSVIEARKLCPQIKIVLARHDRYVHYHHRVIEEVIRHVPINKVMSIDECACRLPPRHRNVEEVTKLAQRIKEGIAQNVGPALKCSIGVSSNMFLAKVASDMQKPNGLTILDPLDLPGRLFELSLTDLPGINMRMKERLRRCRIHTIEDFWNISPRHARAAWGSVLGERMWYNLRGYDLPDIQTNTSHIGHSRILDPVMRTPDNARIMARRLTTKAASRLRRKEYFAENFYLSVRTGDTERWSRERRIAPSQDNYTFLQALNELWNDMMLEMRPIRIKKVSIGLYNLRRAEQITLDLFDQSQKQDTEIRKKNETLTAIMDKVNQKYGGNALHLGIPPITTAGYVGTKIAFSRIPENEEFWE
jgi:DNA polymerase-4